MHLTLRGELAFVTATVAHEHATITVPDFLVDTGAASSVLNADIAGDAGIFVHPADRLRVLRRVSRFAIGSNGVDDFELEIGEMDYGFEIGGVLGMDFLRAAGAIIDLHNLTLAFVV